MGNRGSSLGQICLWVACPQPAIPAHSHPRPLSLCLQRWWPGLWPWSTASFCVDTCALVLVCWFWLQPFPALAAGKPGAPAVGRPDAGLPGRVPSPAWWQTWRKWPLLADKCLTAAYSHYLRKLVDSPLLFPANPAPL